MRIRTYNLIVLTLALFATPVVLRAETDSAVSREYQIKAAFLYNFTMFIDWPQEKTSDPNDPMIIGIVGKDPFGGAFEPLRNRRIRNRKVIVRRFSGFKEAKESAKDNPSLLLRHIEQMQKCHVLFICRSERQTLGEIIASVNGYPVLTIAEMPGFLEAGGVTNFLMEQNKVRFEISLPAAKKANLKIRSNLLKLAKRVIKEQISGDASNE